MLSRYGNLIRSDCRLISKAIKSYSTENNTSHHQSPPVQPSSQNHYDLVINGGGIVGMLFLLYLQKSPTLKNLKVLMLEHMPDRSSLPLKDLLNQERRLSNRVSSFTIASKRLFQQLNIWNDIEPYIKPISSMHVWSFNYTNGVTFTPHKTSILDNLFSYDDRLEEDLQEVVCYILENNILISALRQAIDPSAIQFSTKLNSVQGADRNIYLNLGDGSEIETNLIVGSDGFDSFVRKASNLKQFSIDLDQDAIVGTIQVSKQSFADSNDVAYQRFVPHIQSVLAILPLTDNHASFVLSVPKEKSHSFMEMSDDAFVNLLNESLTRETTPDPKSLLSTLTTTCDNLVNRILPQDKVRALLPRVNPPEILSIESESRACYPLHFGTTIPKMVGKIKGSNHNNVVLIGRLLTWFLIRSLTICIL